MKKIVALVAFTLAGSFTLARDASNSDLEIEHVVKNPRQMEATIKNDLEPRSISEKKTSEPFSKPDTQPDILRLQDQEKKHKTFKPLRAIAPDEESIWDVNI